MNLISMHCLYEKKFILTYTNIYIDSTYYFHSKSIQLSRVNDKKTLILSTIMMFLLELFHYF